MKNPVNDIYAVSKLLILSTFLLVNYASAEIDSAGLTDFQAPPPKKFEQRGEPPAWDYIWVDGYWNWKNNAWVWHQGKYIQAVKERPPVNNLDFRSIPPTHLHTWVPGKWKFEDGDWSWYKGHYIAKPFRNAFWHAGYWRYQAPGWVWIDGHW